MFQPYSENPCPYGEYRWTTVKEKRRYPSSCLTAGVSRANLMTKQRQTPPIQRRKAEPPAPEPTGRRISLPLKREYASRKEQEADIQRLIILVTIVVAVLVAVILVAAFAIDQFVVPNQVVATIDGQNVTVGDFQRRVRFERVIRNERINQEIANLVGAGLDPNLLAQQEPYSTWLRELQVPEQLGSRVVDEIVEERLVRAEAAERGISVSEADIDQQINEFFGYDPEQLALIGAEPTATPEPTITPTPFVSPTPSPEPTATPTLEATAESTAEATAEATSEIAPTAFPTIPAAPTIDATEITTLFNSTRDTFFAAIRRDAGWSDDQIRSYFEYLALRKALTAAIADEEGEGGTLHANIRHILVATEEEAQDIIDALNAGESFANLARAVSTDQGSAQTGGEYTWAPVNNYVEEFADAIREAEIGEIVGPVETEFGFHIIQVRGKENRELEGTAADQADDIAFFQWLEELRTGAEESGRVEVFPAWTENVPADPPFIPRGL